MSSIGDIIGGMNEAMYKKMIKAARKRTLERVNGRIAKRLEEIEMSGGVSLFDSLAGLNVKERIRAEELRRAQTERSAELLAPVL